MVNLSKRIGILLIEQDKEEKQLIAHLDMSNKGFKLMLENETVSLDKLNKIAAFFKVDLSTLLTDNSELQSWKEKYYQALEEKNKLLEEKNQRLEQEQAQTKNIKDVSDQA